jgi:hypothetical protein
MHGRSEGRIYGERLEFTQKTKMVPLPNSGIVTAAEGEDSVPAPFSTSRSSR